MSSDQPETTTELHVDTDNLYREEVVTDMKIGTIRLLVPIHLDGSNDPSRDVVYTGQTQLMSQVGPVPVQCRLEAKSLAEAAAKFPEAMKEAIERLVEEAREIQRREASRIVVPSMTPSGKIDLA